ncbi:MAG: hypothetical protein ABEJ24_05390 [Candidatus Magasanikbacteria bacterium]
MINKIKKISILYSLVLLFFPTVIFSSPLEIPPPFYGYNQEDNICQVKQQDKSGPINKALEGRYDTLRDCRYDNPQIIFNTGLGIIIWFIIFSIIAAFNYLILPRIKDIKNRDKDLYFIRDVVFVGIALFFAIIIMHYFAPLQPYYDYGSDIDGMIYMLFIHSNFSSYVLFLLVGYYLAIFINIKRRQNKKSKP